MESNSSSGNVPDTLLEQKSKITPKRKIDPKRKNTAAVMPIL